MTLVDLFHFFIGDGDAIRQLAADSWTLVVGALLVFTAGLARHHDTHDLLRQSWRLLVPFAASTLAASLLFLVLLLKTGVSAAVVPLGFGILGLFWLTAPFAWLYGLPFERLWRAETAGRARHLTLGVVAAARVVLMTQCVAALLGYSWWESLGIVACFAVWMGALAIIVAFFILRQPEESWVRPTAMTGTARRVIDGMSGVTEEELEILKAAWKSDELSKAADNATNAPSKESAADNLIAGLNGVWALGLLVSPVILLKLIPSPPNWPIELDQRPTAPPSLSVWIAVGLAVLFWGLCLLWRQPAQQRRTFFVARLYDGSLPETLCDLASHWPSDFPPNWKPAAALARHDLLSRLLEATCIAADLPVGSWVRTSFLEEFGKAIPRWTTSYEAMFAKERMPNDQLRELACVRDLLRRLPEAGDMLEPHENYLVELCAFTRERDPPRSVILEDLLALTLKRASVRGQV